jgi:hypothetical protein
MRIFRTRAFSRLVVARKITDADLRVAVAEMNNGLWDANLGGQLYKKRVAVKGRGKRSGARTLVAFQRNERAFFLYGFAKKQRANITAREKHVLKRLAAELFSSSDQQLEQALKHGELIEIQVQEYG